MGTLIGGRSDLSGSFGTVYDILRRRYLFEGLQERRGSSLPALTLVLTRLDDKIFPCTATLVGTHFLHK